MSRPVYEHSIVDATATESGSPLEIGGRITISLFVTATADPAGGLDVVIESSMDGENWSPMFDTAGNQQGLLDGTDFSDPDGNGTFAGHVNVHGVATRMIRARISTHSGGTVNAYVGASSNPASANDFRLTATE